MASLTLYHGWRSSASRRVRLRRRPLISQQLDLTRALFSIVLLGSTGFAFTADAAGIRIAGQVAKEAGIRSTMISFAGE